MAKKEDISKEANVFIFGTRGQEKATLNGFLRLHPAY